MNAIVQFILNLHGVVALALIFALPALEASAFVGVVVPGETAALLGGVLAFNHRVPLAGAVVAAVLGAVVGDGVGYALGRRYGRRLLAHAPHRLVTPERLDRGSSAINRLGGCAVFVGRFTAVLRALVPSLAGTAAMPYRTFAVYNIAGAMLWATGFVVLGYAAGRAFRTAEHIAGQAGLALLGAIVVGAAAALLIRRRRRARQPTTPSQGRRH
jgi:membrane-associated protein